MKKIIGSQTIYKSKTNPENDPRFYVGSSRLFEGKIFGSLLKEFETAEISPAVICTDGDDRDSNITKIWLKNGDVPKSSKV